MHVQTLGCAFYSLFCQVLLFIVLVMLVFCFIFSFEGTLLIIVWFLMVFLGKDTLCI